MMPVPLLFLLLSGLVLIPNYPYYVTFFYTTLGIFLMMQSAREKPRPLLYGTAARHQARNGQVRGFSLVLTIEAMQALVCIPFCSSGQAMGDQKRRRHGGERCVSGLFSRAAWLFNRIFSLMHYKTPTIWGKPFVVFERRARALA